MDAFTATEQAYKNGWKDGQLDALNKIKFHIESIMNDLKEKKINEIQSKEK